MRNFFLWQRLLCSLALVYLLFLPVKWVAAVETGVWQEEGFAKRAQALKGGNWNRVTTRDVAIVQLYEMGRLADKVERKINAQTKGLYVLAYRGALILGAYLALQLLLTLVMVVQLARLRDRGGQRGPRLSHAEF